MCSLKLTQKHFNLHSLSLMDPLLHYNIVNERFRKKKRTLDKINIFVGLRRNRKLECIWGWRSIFQRSEVGGIGSPPLGVEGLEGLAFEMEKQSQLHCINPGAITHKSKVKRNTDNCCLGLQLTHRAARQCNPEDMDMTSGQSCLGLTNHFSVFFIPLLGRSPEPSLWKLFLN